MPACWGDAPCTPLNRFWKPSCSTLRTALPVPSSKFTASAWQARDICAAAASCRRLRGEVADASHLFEQTARGQTAAGVLEDMMRRAAAKAPEFLILLHQMPGVLRPERSLQGKPLQGDWRRACLRYEEDVLCAYMKRCSNGFPLPRCAGWRRHVRMTLSDCTIMMHAVRREFMTCWEWTQRMNGMQRPSTSMPLKVRCHRRLTPREAVLRFVIRRLETVQSDALQQECLFASRAQVTRPHAFAVSATPCGLGSGTSAHMIQR